MIWEGKVAFSFFVAYVLLALTIFQGKRVTEAWSIATGSIILGLSLFVACFVPYSSVARRAAILGKIDRCHCTYSVLLSSGDPVFLVPALWLRIIDCQSQLIACVIAHPLEL